jgi:hypothetical protein
LFVWNPVELPPSILTAAAAVAAGRGQRLGDAGAILKFAKGWLKDVLLDEHNIEVPIFAFEGKLYTRVSAHIYNYDAEITGLASAVLAVAAAQHGAAGASRL